MKIITREEALTVYYALQYSLKNMEMAEYRRDTVKRYMKELRERFNIEV